MMGSDTITNIEAWKIDYAVECLGILLQCVNYARCYKLGLKLMHAMGKVLWC